MNKQINDLELAIQLTKHKFINAEGVQENTNATQRKKACETIVNILSSATGNKVTKRKRGESESNRTYRLVNTAKLWINENKTKEENPAPSFKELKLKLFEQVSQLKLSWLNFNMFSIENTKNSHTLMANFHKKLNGEWSNETDSIPLLESKNLDNLEGLRVKFIKYCKGHLHVESEIDGQYKICFRTGPSTFLIRTHEEFKPNEPIIRSALTAPNEMKIPQSTLNNLKIVK